MMLSIYIYIYIYIFIYILRITLGGGTDPCCCARLLPPGHEFHRSAPMRRFLVLGRI